MDFQFVDGLPMDQDGRRTKGAEFANALRENPSQWGIWPNPLKTKKSANAMASVIRSGRLSNFPAGRFAAVERNGVLYVRYLGEPPNPRECVCACQAQSVNRLRDATKLLAGKGGVNAN